MYCSEAASGDGCLHATKSCRSLRAGHGPTSMRARSEPPAFASLASTLPACCSRPLLSLDCKSSNRLSAIKAAGSAFEVRPAGRPSHHGYYVCAAPARHIGCAFDCCEDEGSGDAGGLGIPFNDGLLRDVDFLQPLCMISKCCGVNPSPRTARYIAWMPAQ